MTQNQVAYHNAKELERHNRATEEEINRHQLVTEELQRRANELQEKANVINQEHWYRMDYETHRSNTAKERQNQWNAVEVQRSNLATEELKGAANAINAAAVAETSRHQKAMENIQETLNNSIIDRNYAEVSVASANKDLIQTRVWNEMQQQANINAQYHQTEAQTALIKAQTAVQKSQAFRNYAEGTRAIIGAASDTVGIVTDVAGMTGGINPTGGSSSVDPYQQYWAQWDAMLQ